MEPHGTSRPESSCVHFRGISKRERAGTSSDNKEVRDEFEAGKKGKMGLVVSQTVPVKEAIKLWPNWLARFSRALSQTSDTHKTDRTKNNHVSVFVFCIPEILAAFDEEKRRSPETT